MIATNSDAEIDRPILEREGDALLHRIAEGRRVVLYRSKVYEGTLDMRIMEQAPEILVEREGVDLSQLDERALLRRREFMDAADVHVYLCRNVCDGRDPERPKVAPYLWQPIFTIQRAQKPLLVGYTDNSCMVHSCPEMAMITSARVPTVLYYVT